jgi:hypothetical protein
MMLIESHAVTAPVRSPRPNESSENYLRRLARARLTKVERAEIDDIYQRLDAEWAAAGRPVPVFRVSWTAEDIVEWQGMTPRERYLDLLGSAVLAERSARSAETTLETETKTATPATKLVCDGVHVGPGTIWASTFYVGGNGDQRAVVAKYERWLPHQHELLRALPQLRGQKLCACQRDVPHGELLLSLAAKSRQELIAWWKATK